MFSPSHAPNDWVMIRRFTLWLPAVGGRWENGRFAFSLSSLIMKLILKRASQTHHIKENISFSRLWNVNPLYSDFNIKEKVQRNVWWLIHNRSDLNDWHKSTLNLSNISFRKFTFSNINSHYIRDSHQHNNINILCFHTLLLFSC